MIELFQRNFDTESAEPYSGHAPRAIFSQADVDKMLAEACESAFQAGHRQGFEQGLADVERAAQDDLHATVKSIAAQVVELVHQVGRHQAHLEEQATDFALAAAERIFPNIQQNMAKDCALQSLQTAFAKLKGVAALEVHLSPATQQKLAAEGIDLAVYAGVGQSVTLVADQAMQAGETRVVWQDGWASYSLEKTCAEILRILRAARKSAGSAIEDENHEPR